MLLLQFLQYFLQFLALIKILKSSSFTIRPCGICLSFCLIQSAKSCNRRSPGKNTLNVEEYVSSFDLKLNFFCDFNLHVLLQVPLRKPEKSWFHPNLLMRNLQKTQFQIFWAQFQGLILRIDWARRSWEKLGSYRKVNSSLHGSKQKSVNASIWVETIFWSKQTNQFKTTDRIFKAWYSKLTELRKARSLPESQLVAAGLELEIGSREYLIGKSILILANKWFQNDPSYFQSLIFRVDRAAKSPALTGKLARCCRPTTRNGFTRVFEWKEHFDLS